MKNNFTTKIKATASFIRIASCAIMFLVIGLQKLHAQTVPATNVGAACNGCVNPGWTLYNGSTDISNQNLWAGYSGFPWTGAPTPLPPNGHAVWVSGYGNEMAGTTITGLTVGKTYTFTFYAVELLSTAGGAIDPNYDGTLRLSNSSTSQTLSTYNFTGGNSTTWKTFTYVFTAVATTLPIAFDYFPTAPQNGNFWNVSFASSAVTTCDAGTTAPTLSTTTISNVCPATTVNLSSITASNMPAGTTLTWHTGTPATTSNKIVTPTAVAAGTYYAAFFDAINNCYSGTSGNGLATTTVLATVNACCIAGITSPTLSATSVSNVCPATTVNLTSITASSIPAGTTLTWHTGTPATTVNEVATPTAVATGIYYAAFFDATNNCYSGTSGNGLATTPVLATVNACVAVATPSTLNTTTGTTVSGMTPLVTSGVAAFVYSDGASDPGCIAPSGYTSLTAAGGTVNSLNSATGAHTITAPATAGNYYYCIRVCDSLGSCTVSIHKVVVVPSCPAGVTAPIVH